MEIYIKDTITSKLKLLGISIKENQNLVETKQSSAVSLELYYSKINTSNIKYGTKVFCDQLHQIATDLDKFEIVNLKVLDTKLVDTQLMCIVSFYI